LLNASPDPREWVADEHVDNAGSPEPRLEEDETLWVGSDLADDRGFRAQSVALERLERIVRA
jgi:hypothetical protein